MIFYQQDKALELGVRKKIYNLVREHAGSHFRDIERKSKLPATSLRYHLNYLSKHTLIKIEKDGGYLRYFPNEFIHDKHLMSLLRQESIRKILLLLLNGKKSYSEIVDFLGLSTSTVSVHLTKLSHVLKSVKIGRETYYELNMNPEEIMRLVITYQESFLDQMVDRVIEMWDV